MNKSSINLYIFPEHKPIYEHINQMYFISNKSLITTLLVNSFKKLAPKDRKKIITTLTKKVVGKCSDAEYTSVLLDDQLKQFVFDESDRLNLSKSMLLTFILDYYLSNADFNFSLILSQ